MEAPSGGDGAMVPRSGSGGANDANSSGRNQKQSRQILKEEKYQQTLSQIVQRDFYPALPSLHRDLAVLEKRAEGDVAGAVAVRRAYRRVADEEEKAAEADREEDARAQSISGGTRKRPRPLERESVTGFHDRATSEDNEEFDRVTRKEESERVDRMRALYSARPGAGAMLQLQNGTAHRNAGDDTSATRTRNQVLGADTPLLPASEQFDAPVIRVVDATAKSTDTNSLFFVPGHYSASDEGVCEGADHGKRRAYNLPLLEEGKGNSSSLMLPPPPRKKGAGGSTANSLVRKDTSSATAATGNPKMDLVEYVPKPGSDVNDVGFRAVPTINAAMTRFPHQGESRLPPASGRRNAHTGSVMAASSSHSIASSDTDTTTDLDATPTSLAGERAARTDAMARERESYVAMTPVILPGGNRDQGSDSPITTWGAVVGTPLVLPGSQAKATGSLPTAGPIDDDEGIGSDHNRVKSFALPAEDGIEATARIAEIRIAARTKAYRDAQSRAKRGEKNDIVNNKSSRTGGSITVRSAKSRSSMHSRTESLTPAARALLARGTPKSSLSSMSAASHGKVSARSSSALGSALRSSYTPMSSPRSSSSSTTRRKAATATPRTIGEKADKPEKAGGITDGLLRM
mmetsp:Transcript_28065/g.81131  ORF Transcript_28065/g.81131 Transcript_28065/m.81131 type:complete len:632 (-) Transcript_28065:121-2016(-)